MPGASGTVPDRSIYHPQRIPGFHPHKTGYPGSVPAAEILSVSQVFLSENRSPQAMLQSSVRLRLPVSTASPAMPRVFGYRQTEGSRSSEAMQSAMTDTLPEKPLFCVRTDSDSLLRSVCQKHSM